MSKWTTRHVARNGWHWIEGQGYLPHSLLLPISDHPLPLDHERLEAYSYQARDTHKTTTYYYPWRDKRYSREWDTYSP